MQRTCFPTKVIEHSVAAPRLVKRVVLPVEDVYVRLRGRGALTRSGLEEARAWQTLVPAMTSRAGECPLCSERYDAEKHAPMVSVSCGHSICARCAEICTASAKRQQHILRGGSARHAEPQDEELTSTSDVEEDDDEVGVVSSSERRRRTTRCPVCNERFSTFVKNFEALNAIQQNISDVISISSSNPDRKDSLHHGDDETPLSSSQADAARPQDRKYSSTSPITTSENSRSGSGTAAHPAPQGFSLADQKVIKKSLADITDVGHIIERSKVAFSRSPRDELGVGSTGVVYRGKYDSRDVAVKCVRSAIHQLAHTEKFVRELKLISRLHNPHIVEFVGAAWDEDESTGSTHPPQHVSSLLLVTELMPGGTLRSGLSSIPQKGGLDIASFLNISTQIARGLVYLHEEGLAHRDIKSANILLSESPIPGTNKFAPTVRAKIADFGLSKYIDSITSGMGHQQSIMEPGRLEATYAYLAPEAFGGDKKNVIRPSDDDDGRFQETAKMRDIYALGVLFWEMLTGFVPWAGTTLPDVYVRVCVRGDRPYPSLEDTRVPEKIRRLVDRCWAQEPRSRPSATSIVAKLESITSKMIRNAAIEANSQPAKPSPPADTPASARATPQQGTTTATFFPRSASGSGRIAAARAVFESPSGDVAAQGRTGPVTLDSSALSGGAMYMHFRPAHETHGKGVATATSGGYGRSGSGLLHGTPVALSSQPNSPQAETKESTKSGSARTPRRRSSSGRTRSFSRDTSAGVLPGQYGRTPSSFTPGVGEHSTARYGPVTVHVHAPSSSPTGNVSDQRETVPSSQARHAQYAAKAAAVGADRVRRSSDSNDSVSRPRVGSTGIPGPFERSPSYAGPATTSGALSGSQGPRVIAVAGDEGRAIARRMISMDGARRNTGYEDEDTEEDEAFGGVAVVTEADDIVEDNLDVVVANMKTNEVLAALSQRSPPARLAGLALAALSCEKHCGEEEVLRNSCALLHRLTVPSNSSSKSPREVSPREQLVIRRYLKSNGAVGALLRLMDSPHLRHPTTLSYALLAVGNLTAWDLDAHAQFRAGDGVPKVAACMNQYKDNMGVQEKCCYALACAAAGYPAKLKSTFADTRCIQGVVAALKTARQSGGHDAVVKQSCAALSAMCSGSPDNASRASGSGAIALLVGCFDAFRESSRVDGGKRNEMLLVCNAFMNLMCSPDNRKIACTHGGTAMVLRAIRIFRLDEDFVEKCIVTLADFSSVRNAAATIVQSNGVDDIVAAMTRFTMSVPVQRASLRSLTLLMRATGDHARRRVVHAGGAEAIVFAMERFGTGGGAQIQVAIEGCRALAMLCAMESSDEGEILSKRMKKLKGVSAIKQTMQAHRGNQAVQEKGRDALKNFGNLKSSGGLFGRLRTRR